MKRILAVAAATAALAAPQWTTAAAGASYQEASGVCRSAGPDTDKTLVLLDGMGTGTLGGGPADGEARAWFDQGWRLAWAFWNGRAAAAFGEAARLDPACVLCLWGEAWALGPTINYPMPDASRARVRELMERARTLSDGAPERTRDLVEALSRRYAADGGDRAFAEAMEALAERHPDDDAVQVIAADARMIADSSWYGRKTSPKVDAAIARLERVLARSPDDTAAIHMYIHVTEWTGDAARAEPYADRLKRLAPAAGHLVHMPSHTYFRIGRYDDAALANAAAVEADAAFGRAVGLTRTAQVPYHAHNVHFGFGAALMSGDAATGLALARTFRERWPEGDSWTGFVAATSWAAEGRLADPQSVLAAPAPQAGPLTEALWRYARGEAQARRGDAAAVRAELAALKRTVRRGDWSALGREAADARRFVGLAELVLEGRVAMLEGRFAEAARRFGRAADRQEAMNLGGDPPLWWYPIRRSEGAARLAAGDPAGADKALTASLKGWPRDPLALYALSEVRRAQGRSVEAEAALALARDGWRGPAEAFVLAGV